MEPVSLALTPPWREEQLILVRAADAIRLCREGGYESLPWWQARAYLDGLGRRDLPNLRCFASRVRLSGFRLSDVDETALRTLLWGSLRVGDLVALRVGAMEVGGDGATAEQRRLLRELAAKNRRRLSYAGRQYRLVADADLGKLPDRDSYEVVGRRDAVQVLAGLAQQAGSEGGDFAQLLGKASGMLANDWRPPLHPEGLILLRRIITLQARPSDSTPAITPSQLKKALGKTEWIEIEVVDDLGKPYTGAYRIELPDGKVTEGEFGKDGLWGDYDIEPGKCKLLLPDVPEAAKPGALPSPPATDQATWIAVKLVDEEGKPIVGRAFTLKLTDGSEHKGMSTDGEVRFDGIAAGTCIFSLVVEHEVAPSPHEDVTVADDSPIDAALGILECLVKDADGYPIVKHKFEAHFPDGTVMKGETDEIGMIHLDNCPSEQCTLKIFEPDSST